MGFAPVAFVESVENSKYLLWPIAALTRPLAEGVTTLAELVFDLIGCHWAYSYVKLIW